MSIADHYKTLTNNYEFNLRGYVTPVNHFDPKK